MEIVRRCRLGPFLLTIGRARFDGPRWTARASTLGATVCLELVRREPAAWSVDAISGRGGFCVLVRLGRTRLALVARVPEPSIGRAVIFSRTVTFSKSDWEKGEGGEVKAGGMKVSAWKVKT